MEKYWVFRQLLDFMADHAEVVDADMNYCNDILIKGETDDQVIEIEVRFTKKEVEQDA